MAARGPKPRPTSLKILHGETHKDRINTNEPDAPSGMPEAPEVLSDEARTEWERVCESLDSMGILSKVDGPAIAAYCETWSRWVQLVRQYNKTGPLTKTTNGNIIQNPLLGAVNKAQNELRAWLCEFGLTPSSRSRVNATPKKKSTVSRRNRA